MSMLSIKDVREAVKKDPIPNMYPPKKFALKQFEDIKDYRVPLKLYKGILYKDINTFFKTGNVNPKPIDQSDIIDLETIGIKGLSKLATIKQVSKLLEDSKYKIAAYDQDVIVYRGVANGTIGQNLFTGECIKSRLYYLQDHRYCKKISDIKLFKDYKNGEDPRNYVYETLGFTSVTTNFDSTKYFAKNRSLQKYDTFMALKLPAGTKFLMPIDKNGYDNEYELILFPGESTFILYDKVDIKLEDPFSFESKKVVVPVYIGAYCNDLNKYRPEGSPFLNTLKERPELWKWRESKKNKPILYHKYSEKCGLCHYGYNLCDPATDECLEDTKENEDRIKDSLRTLNLIGGECSKKKLEECLEKHQFCTNNKCSKNK